MRLKSDISIFVLSRKRLKSVKWIKSYFILKMEIKEKIRYILQYYYDKGKNTPQACEKICAIYGEDTLSKKVERDKHASTMEIARELGIDHKTVLNHLHKAGSKKEARLDSSRIKNMMDRINICDTLLKRNEIESFLKRIITGDEKWITYDNRIRKRSWIKEGEKKARAIAKPGLTTKKIINRRGVVYHHDARSHAFLITRKNCESLASLQNSLNDVKLASKEACENHLKQNIIKNNGAYLV
ncbi:SETMR methyltransferase, partial [Acromyrmex charruanus]